MKLLPLTALILFFIAGTANAQNNSANNSIVKQTPITNSLAPILKLQPFSFEYNKQKNNEQDLPTGTQYGFSTDELKALFPGIVISENKLRPSGKNQFVPTTVDKTEMEKLIPFLVNAIQQQQQQIEELKKEIQSLKEGSAK